MKETNGACKITAIADAANLSQVTKKLMVEPIHINVL
jgi:hypothetical protein